MPIQVKNAAGQIIEVPTLSDVDFATQAGQQAIADALVGAATAEAQAEMIEALGAILTKLGTTLGAAVSNFPADYPDAAVLAKVEAVRTLLAGTLSASITNFPVTQNVAVQGTVPVSGTFYPATQPVSAASLPLPTNAATDSSVLAVRDRIAAADVTIAAVRDRLPATPHEQPLTDTQLRGGAPLAVQGNFYPATQPVSAANLPLPDGAATDVKLDAVITKLDQLLTQMLSPEVSFRERIALTALAKQTFTGNGLRIDAGGTSVVASIAATQTLSTVTTVGTVGAANAVALGRNTADTQGAQQSTLVFQSGFRRNLVAT